MSHCLKYTIRLNRCLSRRVFAHWLATFRTCERVYFGEKVEQAHTSLQTHPAYHVVWIIDDMIYEHTAAHRMARSSNEKETFLLEVLLQVEESPRQRQRQETINNVLDETMLYVSIDLFNDERGAHP
jgi:hypothetical protein